MLINLVAEYVEQMVVEVLNCDLSAEQVYIIVMKFFDIVDVKSKMFKSFVFMLNIVFLRLGRYLHEYGLSSITVTAYQIYRVKLPIKVGLFHREGNRIELVHDVEISVTTHPE